MPRITPITVDELWELVGGLRGAIMDLEQEYMAAMGRLGDANDRIAKLEQQRDEAREWARLLKKRYEEALRMWGRAYRERNSARRVARALYAFWVRDSAQNDDEVYCVLAQEARREKSGVR